MPLFDFDQLWLKSGPLAPEHVAKLIYAPTLYLRGKKKIKPKKVLISIPQRPPWTKRYQRSWFWYQKKRINQKRYWFQYLSGSLMHFHISIRVSKHFIFKAWWALSRVTHWHSGLLLGHTVFKNKLEYWKMGIRIKTSDTFLSFSAMVAAEVLKSIPFLVLFFFLPLR